MNDISLAIEQQDIDALITACASLELQVSRRLFDQSLSFRSSPSPSFSRSPSVPYSLLRSRVAQKSNHRTCILSILQHCFSKTNGEFSPFCVARLGSRIHRATRHSSQPAHNVGVSAPSTLVALCLATTPPSSLGVSLLICLCVYVTGLSRAICGSAFQTT